ncbi:hypothetical protein [Mycobacterium sp. DL99]|uniref:hypothetical protein n=1 Tax=Mycobacterium sp. DL99 TaxID=2528957 RepID=UPI0010802E77|nr:hypothetical protein [Mycobacterium sp. DL99]
MAILALSASSGCETRAPFAPTLTPSWGARVTDGKLQIWTGAPCIAVKRISLSYNLGEPELVLTASSPAGADVEHLTLGGPYPAGLQVTQPWPQGVDWRTAEQLTLRVDAFPPGAKSVVFGSGTEVSEIVDGSPNHPEDTYWFTGVGWLNETDVAAQDGKTFTSVCTPQR